MELLVITLSITQMGPTTVPCIWGETYNRWSCKVADFSSGLATPGSSSCALRGLSWQSNQPASINELWGRTWASQEFREVMLKYTRDIKYPRSRSRSAFTYWRRATISKPNQTEKNPLSQWSLLFHLNSWEVRKTHLHNNCLLLKEHQKKKKIPYSMLLSNLDTFFFNQWHPTDLSVTVVRLHPGYKINTLTTSHIDI